MKIVAAIPASRAAQATAWPWLPALAATTPAARSAAVSEAIVFTAPRILNEPVRWRFSAFSCTVRPGEPRERLGRVDRRDARDPGDPVARGLEVSECRCLCRLQFRTPARGSHARP